MSDIVERLKAGICEDKCRIMNISGGCDCAIAAAEIERLRAQLAEAVAALKIAEAFINQLSPTGRSANIVRALLAKLEDRSGE